MKSLLLLSLFLCYDADRRVSFFNDGQYERDEYHWFAHNTGEPARLFQNGVMVSQEGGTNDIRLDAARALQPCGAQIGVVDINNGHGQRVKAVADLTSGGNSMLTASTRLYPEDISAGISNLVAAGCRVIVVTEGTGPDVGCSNACRFAELSNTVVICSVPNSPVNIDTSPDYPSTWADTITSILPVSSTDRNGEILAGAAAWGTNVVGAPGRNIVCVTELNGTNYSSGTSYAAPIEAGCLSLLIARHPGQSAAAYRQAAYLSAKPIGLVRRSDAVDLLNAPACRLSYGSVVTVQGLPHWEYSIEISQNLSDWQNFTNLCGGGAFIAQPGFFRAKL